MINILELLIENNFCFCFVLLTIKGAGIGLLASRLSFSFTLPKFEELYEALVYWLSATDHFSNLDVGFKSQLIKLIIHARIAKIC